MDVASSDAVRVVVSREPWWKKPPARGQNVLSCEWGWLEIYSDGGFHFDESSRPTDEEILNRKSCFL
jgi:hypothetical protein